MQLSLLLLFSVSLHSACVLWFSLACLMKPLVEPAAQLCVVNRFCTQSHSQLFRQHFYCCKLKGWAHLIVVKKIQQHFRSLFQCSYQNAVWRRQLGWSALQHRWSLTATQEDACQKHSCCYFTLWNPCKHLNTCTSILIHSEYFYSYLITA